MFASVLKFSPNQPRDKLGRWARTGGGAVSVGAVSAASNDTRGYKVDSVVRAALGNDAGTYKRYTQALKELDDDATNGLMTNRVHSVNGDGTGGYTSERKALHRKIVEHHFKDADNFRPEDGKKPKLTVLGGRGGSGKSNFDKERNKEFGVYSSKKNMVIDSDAIKEMLPEYEPSKAFLVHEESSHLANMILRRAKARKLNTVLDITLRSDQTPLVRRFKKGGYDVEAHYMHRSPEGSLRGAVERWNRKTTVYNPITKTSKEFDTGRLVPPQVIESNTQNEANFDKLAAYSSKWSVTSNTSDAGFTGVRRGKGAGSKKAELPWPGLASLLKAGPPYSRHTKH